MKLQELAVKDGVNTRSPDELRAEVQRHRLVAAALGVGSSLADLLGPAFKSYAAADATDEAKAAAVATAQNSMRDFLSLDLGGADSVLQNFDISSAAEKLIQANRPDDPLLVLYNQMVDQYVALFQQSNRDVKAVFIDGFAKVTFGNVVSWYFGKKPEKVVEFWEGSYRGLPLAQLAAGDKDSLVGQLNYCVRSLLTVGRRDEGRQLLTDTLALCDANLVERPWDFYARGTYSGLCFDAAAALDEAGDRAAVQPLLRRGWAVVTRRFGREELLARYPELPPKGGVPKDASPDDAKFFASFAKGGSTGGATGDSTDAVAPTTLHVSTDFGGTYYLFYAYVYPGRNGYAELQDQFRWLKEVRGGSVPKEIRDVFERTQALAVERKVDFRDLCLAEYPKVALEQAEEHLKAAVVRAAGPDKEPGASGGSAGRAQALSEAFACACGAAMDGSRWDKLEQFAKAWLIAEPGSLAAQSKLAISLLAQTQVAPSLLIYQRFWTRREFAQIARGDILSLTSSEPPVEALKRLYRIASDNNVSFADLAIYALGDNGTGRQRLDLALGVVKTSEAAYEKEKSDLNRRYLATTYGTAARQALYAEQWAEAEALARKCLAVDGPRPDGHKNLATALLFQGKYEAAVALYRAHWLDPLDGKTLGDATLAEFASLEKAGITHPDVARARAALGTPTTTTTTTTTRPATGSASQPATRPAAGTTPVEATDRRQ